jgi:uncharacterized protein (DUF4415 family)
MRFEWDEQKNRLNLRKHDVRFATAVLVFDDPYAITQRDVTFEDEKRWITVGARGRVRFYWSFILFMRNTTKKSFASSRLAPPNRTKGEPMRKLTKEQKRDIRVIAAKRDEDIDFSDAPAVVDWNGAEIGKFYRPMKKPVTMRLDSDVIAWLKADGRGYQTKANWLLRQAMTHLAEGTRTASGKGRSRRTGKGK